LKNLTREEFGVNMGDNEQHPVNKKLRAFHGHGNNYCAMKCSLNDNAFLNKSNNMFNIK
jgi:hypothetical protein